MTSMVDFHKILLTHKIDPNVEEEREYLKATLSSTGLVGGQH